MPCAAQGKRAPNRVQIKMTHTHASAMPYFAPGTYIGLFGGSFDPPHAGHRLVSLSVMRTLGLDYVCWLVSPQNPLKNHTPNDMTERLAACQRMASHPRLMVSDVETRIGTQYAIDTVRQLKARHPEVHFTWLMGSDNFVNLQQWKQWQQFMQEVPVVIYPRSGSTLKVTNSQAGQVFARQRVATSQATDFKHVEAPAWIMLDGVRSDLSSSALRQRGANKQD